MSTITEKGAILNLASEKKSEIIRHEFTVEELNMMREEISNNLMKLMDIEEDLKKVKDEFKAKMEPLRHRNKFLLKLNRQKFEDQEVEVYLVPDFENKIMELYDVEGNKLGDRKMLMSELQGRLDLK